MTVTVYSGPMIYKGVEMTVAGSRDALQAVEVGGYNVLSLLSSAARLEIRQGIGAVTTAETALEMFAESELTGQTEMFEAKAELFEGVQA